MTVFETTQWGDQRLSTAFFAELAEALNATDLTNEGHGHASMTVGAVRLSFRQKGWGAGANRMNVCAYAADSEASARAYKAGRPVKFPEATMDPTRTLDAIVRDVTRRLIEKSAPALASIQAMDAQQRANESAIEAAAADLGRAFPTLRIEVRDLSANIWTPGATARLDRDGALTFDRLSVNADKARRILAILTEA